MDLSMLIAILAYVAAVQMATKYSAGPIASSTLAVFLPFVIASFTRWMYFSGTSVPILANLFSLSIVTSFIVQFVFALIIFRNLENEDGYSRWLAWVIGGGVVLILVVPAMVKQVIAG